MLSYLEVSWERAFTEREGYLALSTETSLQRRKKETCVRMNALTIEDMVELARSVIEKVRGQMKDFVVKKAAGIELQELER